MAKICPRCGDKHVDGKMCRACTTTIQNRRHKNQRYFIKMAADRNTPEAQARKAEGRVQRNEPSLPRFKFMDKGEDV